MPMTPEQKAKQTARQEAEWGHTRPEPPPVDNEHVAEGCEQFAEPEAVAETRVVYAIEGAIRSPEIDAALEASMAPVTNTVSKAATTARRKTSAKKK